MGHAPVIKIVQGTAEDGALAAAGGHRAPRELFLPIDDSGAIHRGHRHLLALPVHFHGSNGRDVLDEPLVAEVSQRQGFRVGAQRHERDHLAVVHLDGEREFAGDLHVAPLALLVHRLYRVGGSEPRLAHLRSIGLI